MNGNKIRLRFLSTMRHAVERDEMVLEIAREATVADLLGAISRTLGRKATDILFEEGGKSIRNDLIVLVNDVEVAVLGGIGAVLSDGDVVSLMPVAHGG